MDVNKRKPLLIRLLTILLLVVLCLNLPGEILFWWLCIKQDRDLPPNTEVIVSACKDPVAIGVPGGEVVFVREGRSGRMYLLDLRTGEKKKVPKDMLLVNKGIFLNSELVWLEGSLVQPGDSGYRPHYILDLTNGRRYELLDLDWLPRLEGGKFDPKNYTYFQSAEQVFLHHTENTVIALSSDFRTNQNGRVIFSAHGSATGHGELLGQLMQDLRVDYEIVDIPKTLTLYADIPSPTGRYVVRTNGIYFTGTNTALATREYTGAQYMVPYFKSWYYDESGVVVQEGTDFLITNSFGGHWIPIPHPILKLRLPTLP